MFKSIREKKVLITGATGGIGAIMALLFAEHGATLGLHYNSEKEKADLLSGEVEKHGVKVYLFQANLLEESGEALVDAFIDRFGGIDILINNAGAVFGFKDFLELDNKSWEKTFKLNAQAPFFMARRAFAHMKQNGGGKIINISSVAAKYGGSERSLHYGSAKAALEAETIGLARAGAKYGILVNAIRGGFIDTPFHHKLGSKNIEKRVQLIPLKRAGQPEDVANMALFLTSECGDFITGEIMAVAGGD
jgi:NAD(P)-dependent dehydrogenase (short-subunit alcohol dehydrogenase family)